MLQNKNKIIYKSDDSCALYTSHLSKYKPLEITAVYKAVPFDFLFLHVYSIFSIFHIFDVNDLRYLSNILQGYQMMLSLLWLSFLEKKYHPLILV